MTDDASTIQRVLSGETDAFAELVAAHGNRIRQLCLGLLGNPVDADEAAHVAFVKAFESLARFRTESSFLTWVSHIAHNHCMDLLRRRTSRKTDSLDALMEEGGPRLEEALRAPAAPESPEENTEVATRLLSAMRREHREILLLREVGELSYDQIAAKLSISVEGVRGRLRRARVELREKSRHLLRV